MGIHRPGQILLAGRAEFAASHEHHIRKLRQRFDLPAIQEVSRDTLDLPILELLAQPSLAEPGHADNTFVGCSALGEPCQCAPNLSSYSQNNEVAGNSRELGYQHFRWRSHDLFEVLEVAEPVRQGSGLRSHRMWLQDRECSAT